MIHKCQGFLDVLPKEFDRQKLMNDFPVRYEDSINTFLQLEVQRYDTLLQLVRKNLKDTIQALTGFSQVNNEIDSILKALQNNKVPDIWQEFAYPSLKPLSSWFQNLLKRLKFISGWIQEGNPKTFWLSGFFFTQSFLTCIKQDFARKVKTSIEQVSIVFKCLQEGNALEETEKLCLEVGKGRIIYGLYLDGARWDNEGVLGDQFPGQLINQMCPIWCMPQNMDDIHIDEEKHYLCPLYRTALRYGDLTSTGHSENWILNMHLPIKPEHTPHFWVKRGLAMLTELSD